MVAAFDQNGNFRYNRKHSAPLAQLDRASGYEPEGREFESLRARHSFLPLAGDPIEMETGVRVGTVARQILRHGHRSGGRQTQP